MVQPFELRRHRGVSRRWGSPRPRPARAAAGRRCPHVTGPLPVTATSYPFGAADHTLVPEDLQEGRLRRGRVPRQRQGQRLQLAGARPGRRCARRTRRTRRASSCAGRRRPRASAATSSSRCSTRPTGSTSTSAGRMAHRQMVAQRRRLGRASPTSRSTSLALKKFDPARYGSLSFANPLRARRSAQLPNPVSSVDPPSALADHRGRAGLGHLQPGRRAACAAATAPTRWPTAAAATAGAAGTRHAVVKHVYGFGYSQTGGYLYDYINAIHPLDVAAQRRAPDLRRLHRGRRGRQLRGRRADQPVRAAAAAPATRACSSRTSACRSSTSCRSRTTCSASTPGGPTATRPPTATATTRWPAPRTRRPTS